MKKIKFVIIYNQCLRSKLIYYNFIKKNKNKIHSAIKIPVIKNKNLISEMILFIKLYKKYSKIYLFYTIFQTIIFNFLSKIFKSDIEHLCKDNNINHFELKEYPDNKFWKKNNLKKNYIIFSSTTHILKKNELNIDNLVINFHEADPRILRGSALYFQLMVQNFIFFRTCMLEPNLNIDEGRIVKLSKKINIKYKSLFGIILKGYLSQAKIINSTNYQRLKKKFPKKNSLNKVKTYTFPDKTYDILLKDKTIFSLKELSTILKLMIKK